MKEGLQVNVLILQICCQFLAEPATKLWAYEISKRLKQQTPTITKALVRLERDGWLVSEWERVQQVGWRPRRKLYRITPAGLKRATDALKSLRITAP